MQQGDLVTFKANDGKYKVLLCVNTRKGKRSECLTCVALTYSDGIKPKAENILNTEFWGTESTSNEYFSYSSDELSHMWNIHPDLSPYGLGVYGIMLWRKDFEMFKSNFEIIGHLNIVDNLENMEMAA